MMMFTKIFMDITAHNRNSAILIIILTVLFIGAILWRYYFRGDDNSSQQTIVRYEEDESEGEKEEGYENHLFGAAKYRADWLTMFTNYLIIAGGNCISEEPHISACSPKNDVSVICITDTQIQLNIAIKWRTKKVVLSGYWRDDEVGTTLISYSKTFRWKGFDVPFMKIDCFMEGFMESAQQLVNSESDEDFCRDFIQFSATTHHHLLPSEKEEEEVAWLASTIDELAHQIKQMPNFCEKKKYMMSLGKLNAYFAKKFGENWFQKFNFDQEVINDILSILKEADEDNNNNNDHK